MEFNLATGLINFRPKSSNVSTFWITVDKSPNRLGSGLGKCLSELRGLRQLLASQIGVMMVVMIKDGDQVDMVTEM